MMVPVFGLFPDPEGLGDRIILALGETSVSPLMFERNFLLE
jgi:hypothetical protein